jgi:tetratricopeptide (TPR) repeat protein
VAPAEEAIRLKPDYARAYIALGLSLRALGRFSEALDAFRRAQELGSRQVGWPTAKVNAWIRQLERPAALDRVLPAFLSGERTPSAAGERIELAQVCSTRSRRLYAAAARYYAAAFTERQALAGDLAAGHRYRAARSAALAGRALSDDRPQPDAREQAAFRGQALELLRQDLADWSERAAGGKPQTRALVVTTMHQWRQDADLSGVRHPWSLLRLPADERRSWQTLWADVDELRKKASRN